jgi:membrane protein DedA with SNARE-associated domain
MDIITWITDAASSLPDPLVWGLGGLFSFLEAGLGLGFVFPGETIVLILSAALDDPVSAVVMGVVVAVFASAGDHVGYLLGRRLGSGIRDGKIVRKLGQENWDRAVAVLEKRGAWAVFLTRLVPVIRTLMPAAAGVAKLRYPSFLAASLGGAATWALVYVGCGALLRGSIDAVQKTIGQAVWVLIAAAIVAAVVVVLVRRSRKRRAADAIVDPVTGIALEDVRRTAPDRSPEDIRQGRRASVVVVGRAVLVVAFAVLLLLGRDDSTVRTIAAVLPAVVLVGEFVRVAVWGRIGGYTGTAIEPVALRLTTIAFVVGLTVSHLLPVSLLIALVVPDLLLAAFATVTHRHGIRPTFTIIDRLRDLVLLVAPVLLLLGFSNGLGSVGSLCLFAGIILTAVVAAQVARNFIARWQFAQLDEDGADLAGSPA